ncbi:GFA family protein [Shewanella sp. 1_MG-2023]|uniref:GFA family protein n=1 Tax=Shewanella electrodiphila TaxID=934143 RepID=A0ABT0KSC2_9GAMM|nr:MULTISPECIES: GFA family protein [Shewanella]MCL1046746.1 GFA family protein [Shewanella electrodiphila]MDO6613436.1 GFA family protein [Shewanella sp. 7_MG-2023]MDO6770102.1 GFA family protein [Shewanella sp. 2_MG-2023]MDO6794786.1 GFA family protein [Shewanella sp. 1_MG-2023]PMG78029.1 aldehyde-activating protein [Shewanella sp. 10N.286.51.B7]
MVNLTEVNGVEVMPKHRASCHCGLVVMELSLPKGIQDVRRCDCSMCRRRGAIVASINLDDIQFIQGEHELSVYQFNTKTAKHYFCRHCGIYTHHQRRSNPNQFGFNVACLAGINPLKIDQVKLYDGVNHPADR